MRLILHAVVWGGVTGRIAWLSDLMWKMSLRETNRLQNGVNWGGRVAGSGLRVINI